jgi:hypothetical protein
MAIKTGKLMVLTLAAIVFCGGCGLGTPTRYEQTVTAEYDLSKHKGQKMLVLVEQPSWLEAGVNLRYYLTETINAGLEDDVKAEPNQLIAYDTISKFRASHPDFSLMSPAQIGGALGTDLVLYVTISRYELTKEADSDYYMGLIDVEAVLINVPDERKLWPLSQKSRNVKAGFDIEDRGEDVARQRLVKGLTHCIVRSFYDCPKDKYEIAEDRSNFDWDKW